MIRSKYDLKYYLKADAIALGMQGRNPILTRNPIWSFQRLLRKTEYLENAGKTNHLIYKVYYWFLRARLSGLKYKLGFTIGSNNFGPGLSIAHYGTIVVNAKARIGANCRINACVNIGNNLNESQQAPKIGNNVFIAPGAKIFGNIEIADGIAIGANAVVNKSFLQPNITIAGIPAKKISDIGTEKLVIRATELVDEGHEHP
jgi:serine O-acetyltransferase